MNEACYSINGDNTEQQAQQLPYTAVASVVARFYRKKSVAIVDYCVSTSLKQSIKNSNENKYCISHDSLHKGSNLKYFTITIVGQQKQEQDDQSIDQSNHEKFVWPDVETSRTFDRQRATVKWIDRLEFIIEREWFCDISDLHDSFHRVLMSRMIYIISPTSLLIKSCLKAQVIAL